MVQGCIEKLPRGAEELIISRNNFCHNSLELMGPESFHISQCLQHLLPHNLETRILMLLKCDITARTKPFTTSNALSIDVARIY